MGQPRGFAGTRIRLQNKRYNTTEVLLLTMILYSKLQVKKDTLFDGGKGQDNRLFSSGICEYG